jgi:hypothetical protein
MKHVLFTAIFLVSFATCCFSANSKIVEYNANYRLVVNGVTSKVQMICVLPQDIENVQHVKSIDFSRPANRVFEKNGTRYAEFLIESENGIFPISISVKIELFNHDFNSVKKGRRVSIDSPEKYLMSEKFIQKDDSLIKSWEPFLLDKDTLKTIKNIYDYVSNNMEYSLNYPGQKGASRALKQLTGDCTEFTDLFVTLCRSLNIPAIAVSGYVLDFSVSPLHSWAEVYCGKYGWFRLDPTTGRSSNFNILPNNYVHLSSIRNDETLRGSQIQSIAYWGEPIKIYEDIITIDKTRNVTRKWSKVY